LQKRIFGKLQNGIKKKSQGLGIKFTSEVREKVRFIKQNPLASNIRYDEVRTAVLNIFPYMIHYTVEEPEKIVIVSAVFHTSRDPELWKTR
jgi:plasmid stabilization system protein ParE